MKYFNDLSEFNESRASAITIGKFDGLHAGHRLLVADIVSKKEVGMTPLLFSFSNSPRQFIEKTGYKMILTSAERIEVVESLGVDYFAEVPFDEAMMQIEAEDFIKLLIEKLNMKHICVGEDFRFGHFGKGNIEVLRECSEKYGFTLSVIKKLRHGDEVISSTYIRQLISEGDIALADELLRSDYKIGGQVVHGKALGRTLGIPTINILPSSEKLLPKFGVYYTTVILDGKKYPSITNVGVKPTVTDEKREIVESHLLDVSGDFYGKDVEILFHDKLRDEMKFSDIDELQKRMQQDVLSGRDYFSRHSL